MEKKVMVCSREGATYEVKWEMSSLEMRSQVGENTL